MDEEKTEEKKAYSVAEAVDVLKQTAKKRNFTQSFDLIINLKNIDLRKPENKFSREVALPHGRGKEAAVGIFSDTINGAVSRNDIDQMGKKEIRKLVHSSEFFLSEAPLMTLIGKSLGKYLGPVGKMPSPFPAGLKDVSPLVATKKRSVRIKLRDSPTIQVPVGTEQMETSAVEENARQVLTTLEGVLPKGRNQIKNVGLKLTMTKPVAITY